MKHIIDEGIKNKAKFENIPPLTQDEVKGALDFIIKKIDESLDEFTYKYPAPASVNNVYPAIDNIEWTNSFWTGMLWLAYEYTGDEKYRKVAEIQCEDFANRIEKQICVDHHDLGFLYTLSCVAGYKLTGNEKMKETAIKAADKLITRYKEKGQFIQAWGAVDDPKAYRLIIDCYLNVPLLYWASEVTGDKKYYEIGYNHAKTALENVIREDSSAFHTFYFDPETGAPDHGATAQGYSDDSSWARGQAWGVYGLPLSYIYTKDKDFLDTAEKVTNYFLNRLPEDYVCYWDLIFSDVSGQERDSSAAAIAICGMLEIIKHIDDNYKPVYENACAAITRSLTENYTTVNTPESNGILLHAVYAKANGVNQGNGVDECNIWGDYYYMEALMRYYNKDWKLYW